jgi:hypothetical protein
MKFQCWRDDNGLTFAPIETIEMHKRRGLMESDAEFLYEVEADSWNEAMQKHYDKQGWGIYRPMLEDA